MWSRVFRWLQSEDQFVVVRALASRKVYALAFSVVAAYGTLVGTLPESIANRFPPFLTVMGSIMPWWAWLIALVLLAVIATVEYLDKGLKQQRNAAEKETRALKSKCDHLGNAIAAVDLLNAVTEFLKQYQRASKHRPTGLLVTDLDDSETKRVIVDFENRLPLFLKSHVVAKLFGDRFDMTVSLDAEERKVRINKNFEARQDDHVLCARTRLAYEQLKVLHVELTKLRNGVISHV